MALRTNYYGYRNRGWLRECQNDFSSAIADYNLARKVAPQMPFIFKDLHRVHLKTGQFKLALIDANEAIKRNLVTADGYYLRALTKLKMHNSIATKQIKSISKHLTNADINERSKSDAP